MISVLFLIPTLDRGGAENVLVDLVNHMDQSKFQITVQTLFNQNSQKDRLREGIEYRTFLYHQFHGNSRLMAWIPARFLYKLIIRKRYDVVISYLEGPTSHIISGCPFKDTKRVAWFHSALKSDRGFRAGFASKRIAVKAYLNYDAVVFVANTVKSTIEKTAGVSFQNTKVLYNTLNTEMITTAATENVKGFPLSEGEFNIISTGKIASVKGYDRLAKVQKKLKSEGYPTHVYVLGTGPDQKKIEEYIDQNGFTESFTFLGFQKNPYKYVKKADLFVCSSRREGFSTAVSEALVLGIPVVSTNCSGTIELLGEHNEYGIVTENNTKALYQGIKSLLDDPDLLEFYKKQASLKGKSFSVERTVNEVERMILGI